MKGQSHSNSMFCPQLLFMTHWHGVSTRKGAICICICIKKQTNKKTLQESTSVVDFPSRVFHCFSQCSCVCVRTCVRMSSSPHVSWWNHRFSLWGPLGSIQTGGIYMVFPLCSGHLLLKGTPINVVYLVKQEVGQSPCGFTEFVEGSRESTWWGFSQATVMTELCLHAVQSGNYLFAILLLILSTARGPFELAPPDILSYKIIFILWLGWRGLLDGYSLLKIPYCP